MSMMMALTPLAVNPTPAPVASFSAREAWWAGFSAGLSGKPDAGPFGYAADRAESFRAGHWSGADNRATDALTAAAEALAMEEMAELAVETLDHTAADESEYLGWTLGAGGVDAEPAGVLTSAQRVAFAAGHNAGDDHLWTVDPLWAAHLREMAERSRFAAYDEYHRHEMATRDHFDAIERVNAEEFNRRRRPALTCPSMVD